MDKMVEIYSEVYGILENRTPVMFDCGTLCNSACCQNNNLGMLLFPFEEVFLTTISNDFIFKDSNIEIDGYKVKLLYCSGTCRRTARPISCRIFPLFPFTYESGRISVEFDPRASGLCPLLFTDLEEIYMSGLFRLMVHKASVLLAENPLIMKFMVNLTQELDTLKLFRF